VSGDIRIAFVVAVAENGVIGSGGRLPWHLPSDLKRFRKLTLGKPVIMGRKTYESIGKPLEGRDNIVITRQRDYAPPGTHVVGSFEEAVALARTLAAKRSAQEIVVIGGADVFRAALADTDRVYLTLVRGAPAGDTYFETLDPAVWRETAREAMNRTPADQFPADFIVLDRKN
jgi:dihydrofolate reductase